MILSCFVNCMSSLISLNIWFFFICVVWKFIWFSHRAYFARNLLSVVTALLDTKQLHHLKILGCQTLTRFVYNQVSFGLQLWMSHFDLSLPCEVCSVIFHWAWVSSNIKWVLEFIRGSLFIYLRAELISSLTNYNWDEID